MENKDLLPIQLECTMLFQTNPFMVETVEGIGKLLNRSYDELVPILNLLVKQGIIQNLGDNENPRYRYNEPAITTEIDLTGTVKKA
ncbi:hypothetical protein SAMN05216389_1056 [Oceanobacillus limi]|uniref:Uncharacterized protein n=1 Tax=Oceanobacillus limi TaxID=930131 RepID=A0A1I0BG41_9BACI|nr:hypothetical protein [Oceanobacillus limi]SET05828.1 hypothetical protein SAMN05216389_1056 [Oceanobacillus limi]